MYRAVLRPTGKNWHLNYSVWFSFAALFFLNSMETEQKLILRLKQSFMQVIMRTEEPMQVKKILQQSDSALGKRCNWFSSVLREKIFLMSILLTVLLCFHTLFILHKSWTALRTGLLTWSCPEKPRTWFASTCGKGYDGFRAAHQVTPTTNWSSMWSKAKADSTLYSDIHRGPWWHQAMPKDSSPYSASAAGHVLSQCLSSKSQPKATTKKEMRPLQAAPQASWNGTTAIPHLCSWGGQGI